MPSISWANLSTDGAYDSQIERKSTRLRLVTHQLRPSGLYVELRRWQERKKRLRFERREKRDISDWLIYEEKATSRQPAKSFSRRRRRRWIFFSLRLWKKKKKNQQSNSIRAEKRVGLNQKIQIRPVGNWRRRRRRLPMSSRSVDDGEEDSDHKSQTERQESASSFKKGERRLVDQWQLVQHWEIKEEEESESKDA